MKPQRDFPEGDSREEDQFFFRSQGGGFGYRLLKILRGVLEGIVDFDAFQLGPRKPCGKEGNLSIGIHFGGLLDMTPQLFTAFPLLPDDVAVGISKSVARAFDVFPAVMRRNRTSLEQRVAVVDMLDNVSDLIRSFDIFLVHHVAEFQDFVVVGADDLAERRHGNTGLFQPLANAVRNRKFRGISEVFDVSSLRREFREEKPEMLIELEMGFDLREHSFGLFADSRRNQNPDIRIVDEPLDGVGHGDDGGFEVASRPEEDPETRSSKIPQIRAVGVVIPGAFLLVVKICSTLEFLERIGQLAVGSFFDGFIVQDGFTEEDEVGAGLLPVITPARYDCLGLIVQRVSQRGMNCATREVGKTGLVPATTHFTRQILLIGPRRTESAIIDPSVGA